MNIVEISWQVDRARRQAISISNKALSDARQLLALAREGVIHLPENTVQALNTSVNALETAITSWTYNRAMDGVEAVWRTQRAFSATLDAAQRGVLEAAFRVAHPYHMFNSYFSAGMQNGLEGAPRAETEAHEVRRRRAAEMAGLRSMMDTIVVEKITPPSEADVVLRELAKFEFFEAMEKAYEPLVSKEQLDKYLDTVIKDPTRQATKSYASIVDGLAMRLNEILEVTRDTNLSAEVQRIVAEVASGLVHMDAAVVAEAAAKLEALGDKAITETTTFAREVVSREEAVLTGGELKAGYEYDDGTNTYYKVVKKEVAPKRLPTSITAAMKHMLGRKGYTDAQIAKMTLARAIEVLEIDKPKTQIERQVVAREEALATEILRPGYSYDAAANQYYKLIPTEVSPDVVVEEKPEPAQEKIDQWEATEKRISKEEMRLLRERDVQQIIRDGGSYIKVNADALIRSVQHRIDAKRLIDSRSWSDAKERLQGYREMLRLERNQQITFGDMLTAELGISEIVQPVVDPDPAMTLEERERQRLIADRMEKLFRHAPSKMLEAINKEKNPEAKKQLLKELWEYLEEFLGREYIEQALNVDAELATRLAAELDVETAEVAKEAILKDLRDKYEAPTEATEPITGENVYHRGVHGVRSAQFRIGEYYTQDFNEALLYARKTADGLRTVEIKPKNALVIEGHDFAQAATTLGIASAEYASKVKETGGPGYRMFDA
jgi:hypothetical protein